MKLKDVNCVIDWGKNQLKDKVSYFYALRLLINELALVSPENVEILRKYKVDFILDDDLPRVNIDFPDEI